jgi:hypothetical protein
MKLEVMSGFRQTWPNQDMWSNKPEYKIRVCVTFEEYDRIIKLKGEKDISFTLKMKDESFCGFFNLKHIRGLSGWNKGRIIQIHLSNLESHKTTKDQHRDLVLSELLS